MKQNKFPLTNEEMLPKLLQLSLISFNEIEKLGEKTEENENLKVDKRIFCNYY
jgi:hypothetical protein